MEYLLTSYNVLFKNLPFVVHLPFVVPTPVGKAVENREEFFLFGNFNVIMINTNYFLLCVRASVARLVSAFGY